MLRTFVATVCTSSHSTTFFTTICSSGCSTFIATICSSGCSAFSATMLALHVRDLEGTGQHVDVSAMETMTVAQIHASIQHQFGHTPKRRDNTLVPAQDGWAHPGLDRGIGADARLVLGEEIRHSILSLTIPEDQAEE